MSLGVMNKCFVVSVMTGFLLSGLGLTIGQAGEGDSGVQVVRVLPAYAYQEVSLGRTLLVCAYSDPGVCGAMTLKGAISLKELEAKLPELKKDQEIIFYCA